MSFSWRNNFRTYVQKFLCCKNFHIESPKIFGFPKMFLSFKMILDKAGGMGTKLAKNDHKTLNNNIGEIEGKNYFENIDNLYEFIPKSNHSKCTG